MSRDDAPDEQEEPPTADGRHEPERVIDADIDVEPGAEVATDTGEGDSDTDVETSDADTDDTDTGERDSDDETVADSVDGAEAATDEGLASDAETTETQTDADAPREPAMRSGDGLLLGYGGWTLLMLLLQIVVTVGFVGLTAQSLPVVDGPLVPPGVPSYVYVYAGLGAVGYTFTRAVTVDVTTERIADWTVRIFAALPLAAATYLLSTIVVAGGAGGGGELTRRQLAFVALLTGLFVNTAYARLDAAAKRLLGPSR